MLNKFFKIKNVVKIREGEIPPEKPQGKDINFLKVKELFDAGKTEEAFAEFEKIYNTGNSEAGFYLGLIYEEGRAREPDIEKAFLCYKNAAGAGIMDAQHKLGKMFAEGKGVEKDYSQAATLFGKAGDKGHVKALFNLGVINEFGLGVMRDANRAEVFYQKAADAGLAEGMVRLAKLLFQKGKNEEAKALFDKALAQNKSKANLFIQKILAESGKTDINQQVAHLYEAYKAGDSDAGLRLGKLLVDGGRPEDAFKLFNNLARSGNPEAIHNLANMYYCGLGTDKDWEKTIDLYKTAAEKGFSLSCLNFGIINYTGKGVEANKDEAFRWIKKGADAGCAKACYLMSLFLLKGAGCALDEAKSESWFKRGVKLTETNKDIPIKINLNNLK
jgi:TPR repeat protein